MNTTTTNGEASLLITPTQRYVLTNNIEATRIEKEEQLARQGWELQVGSWFSAQNAVARLTGKLKLGADGPYPGAIDLSGEVARLRACSDAGRGRTLPVAWAESALRVWIRRSARSSRV